LYKTTHISEILNAKCIGHSNHDIKHLLIDSRQLTEPNHTLFIALISKRNDAHQYIFNLYQSGVKTFLVSYIPENCKPFSDACFIKVDNTLTALQTLTSYHRHQFNTVVPQLFRGTSFNHQLGNTPFELLNTSLGGLHPWGIWLCLLQMADGFSAFSFKVT